MKEEFWLEPFHEISSNLVTYIMIPTIAKGYLYSSVVTATI